MTANNRRIALNRNRRPQNPAAPGLKLCFCILGFALVRFGPLTCDAGPEIPPRKPAPEKSPMQVPHPQDANSPNGPRHIEQAPQQPQQPLKTAVGVASELTARTATQTPDSEQPAFKIPKTDAARTLWKTRITPCDGPEDDKSKNELRRMIEQIRSIQFKKPEKTSAETVLEPVRQTEPNKAPADASSKKPEPQSNRLSEKTLRVLQDLLQNPEQIENPSALAEVLYRTGHLQDAAACYRLAFDRRDPNDPALAADRAWSLFQIGNCLRSSDQQGATEAYTKLIQQYSGSTWTALAEARRRLLYWYLQDKPKALIDQYK